ncbi:MAG: ComEC/Rec2 family competence protein [Candidatus Bipolaricaulota bacterium]|nr:MAG: ComEC/Rec2 family competence protein [Candidatus Bipolaricaulota bacterium]
MVALALAFVCGMLVERIARVPVLWLLLGSVASLLLAAALGRRRQGLRVALLLAGVALLGGARWGSSLPTAPGLGARAPWLKEASGTIVTYPDLGDTGTGFTLEMSATRQRIRVYVLHDGARPRWLHVGDRIHLEGSIETPERINGFDYPQYLARRSIFLTATVPGAESVSRVGFDRGFTVARAGDELRQRSIDALYGRLPREGAALAAALLFGERKLLPERTEEAFKRLGVMHVLATSGLHLGILMAGLWFGLRSLRLRVVVIYPVALLAAASFLWIVGPRVSLVRAVLMLAFLGAGVMLADCGLVLRRWVEPLHGLAFALVIALVLTPWELLEGGLQLSFGATFAILFGMRHVPLLNDRSRGGPTSPVRSRAARWSTGLLRVSLLAHVGTAPLVALHFATYHPIAILANLIVVPLVTATLWGGMVVLLTLATPLGEILVAPLGWVLSGITRLAQGLATIPGADLPCSGSVTLWLAALAAWLFASLAVQSSWTRNSMSIAPSEC